MKRSELKELISECILEEAKASYLRVTPEQMASELVKTSKLLKKLDPKNPKFKNVQAVYVDFKNRISEL